MYNGMNLSNTPAPPKEPHKCALKPLDKLFSVDELRHSVLLPTRRSNKPHLDSARVDIMFGKYYISTFYWNSKSTRYFVSYLYIFLTQTQHFIMTTIQDSQPW